MKELKETISYCDVEDIKQKISGLTKFVNNGNSSIELEKKRLFKVALCQVKQN